jgi:hypothetical protein
MENTTDTKLSASPPLPAPAGSAVAIQIETFEYAAHLCHQCDGLSVQAAWKIEAIIKRLSPNH